MYPITGNYSPFMIISLIVGIVFLWNSKGCIHVARYTLRLARLALDLLLEVVVFLVDARAAGFFVLVARVDVFPAVFTLDVVLVVLFGAVVSCSPASVGEAAPVFEDAVARRGGFAVVASDAPSAAADEFLRVARCVVFSPCLGCA